MSDDLEPAASQAVLVEELRSLAHRAGHDLTGTLNQAATLISLFLRRHPQPEESDKALIGHLENAAQRIEDQIAGLKGYLDVAAFAPEHQMVSAAAPLAACEIALRRRIAETGARIVAGPLPEVFAHPGQLQILFEELIGNALRFRNPLVPPVIEVAAVRNGGFEVFTVTDNGVGMDPEQAGEALLPFRRLSGREVSGIGLGLATAGLIVRLHGGSIAIRSRPGGGTCVSFTMRAVAPQSGA